MRILFIASSFDVQTTYWIKQIESQNWDIHIFDPKNLIHPELRKVTVHTGWAKKDFHQSVQIKPKWPFLRGKFFIKNYFPRIWNGIVPDEIIHLDEIIDNVKPDIIHILGAIPYGLWFINYYKKIIKSENYRPIPWIYQCKGSDLYSTDNEKYNQSLRSLCNHTRYYIANCNRDYDLARSFGFSGKLLGLFQGMGAYPIDEMQNFKSSYSVDNRNIIAVKGLFNSVLRADIAVDAIAIISDHLIDKKIVFFQTHASLIPKIEMLRKNYGLNIEVMPRSSPWEIFKLFGKSKIAIGINETDGIPNAMIEAMIMGAFPIQTNPGNATSEWIINGENGILINELDPKIISKEILRIIKNKNLLIKAEKLNDKITRDKIDQKKIKRSIVNIYSDILNEYHTKNL